MSAKIDNGWLYGGGVSMLNYESFTRRNNQYETAIAMPIPRQQKPRYARATANSCLPSGARVANTSAMTPATRKSIELETTNTAYSDGVGFLKSRENINRVTSPNKN